MAQHSMYHNIELRKLPEGKLYTVVDILEDNDLWTYIISHIPKNPTGEQFEPKYNEEHVRLIKNHARESGRKCTEILFDEWGTSGRRRPTLNTLKDVLIKAEIFRAADTVARMLNEDPPARPLDGPAAPVDIDFSALLKIENDNFIEMCDGTTAQVDGNNFSGPVLSCEVPRIDLESTAEVENNLNERCADTTAQINGNILSGTIRSFEIPRVFESTTESGDRNEELSNESRNIPRLDIILPSFKIPESPNSFKIPTQIFETEPNSSPKISDLATNSHTVSTTDTFGDPSKEATSLINFKYNVLEGITNGFSDASKVGSGGFGEVFKGYHVTHGKLAVKKTHESLLTTHKEITVKLFDTEVKLLSQLRHKNIVPIIGISTDGPAKCIVCEFVDGGSLEDKLKEKFLNVEQRVNIMLGTAEALTYLHSGGGIKLAHRSASNNSINKNFIHGDIKSANILLTTDYVPKICDFGLAKELRNTYFQVSSRIGTLAYMAPEWHIGTITQKVDIFSYGVVLLEILTGLPAIITIRGEDIHIMHYVKDNCPNNITDYLDTPIRKWKKANKIYKLAKTCLCTERKERPAAENIRDSLNKMVKELNSKSK